MNKTKVCTKCGEEKPVNEFYIKGTLKDGKPRYDAWCKWCFKVYQKNKWISKKKDDPSFLLKHRERTRLWRKRNPERWQAIQRRKQEKRRFAESLENSQRSAETRGYLPCMTSESKIRSAFTGKCFVCGISESECDTRLNLDHDHETGKFRGWLCRNCNTALGHAFDSTERLLALAEYIEEGNLRNAVVA